ncbi:G5 and 3D domain-containing protein [Falsibacillus pallidus]|uniref:Uncharacterized protein YabE (DUF348 family) n=1 Tax=Falsibacillus pallidus TaxID=493781 RepID=A0A370G3I0_9BACI|nr:G5 and 3D domain-containing protein [Falsibacillus pallidus]RDI38398.1 uncharacterized protein YabE (DUF348 family) [Falsibacillus pallidus]
MKFENMKNLFSKSISKKKWVVITASLLVCMAAVGVLMFEGSKKTVALTLNGEKKIVNTHAATVGDIFKDLKISVRSEDYLFPSADAKIKDDSSVVWKQAKKVGLKVGNKEKTVWTTAETVGELLQEQKVKVGEHDKINPAIGTNVKNNMNIAIENAFPFTLVDGGKKKEFWSTSTTVADFLEQQGITLKSLDRVKPGLNQEIEPNDVINVVRVEKVTDVVEEPTDFAVVTKKDSSLAKGKQKVIHEGKKGVISKHYEIVKENGKEVSRKLLATKKVKNSEDKVVAVGTKTLVALASRGKSESGGKEFFVSSTAYTAHCNGCSGHTATGINLKSNPGVKVIAVDPRVIPLGTKVYVEGYGYAVAADTGSAINGFKIDVFFSSKSDAYRWGRKRVKIRILN